MADYRDELERRAGGLASLDASNEAIARWNRGVAKGKSRSFDDRVLLGMALRKRRPAHGDVVAFEEAVGKRLERGARWVRLTMQGAGAVEEAFRLNVALPVAIREVPWVLVPRAVENAMEGRALDYSPPKVEPPPTKRKVRKLVKELVATIGRMEDQAARREAAQDAAEALQELAASLERGPASPGVVGETRSGGVRSGGLGAGGGRPSG